MFKKKTASKNPEVRAAVDARDQLMAEVRGAVEKVDRLQNELLDEYAAAERLTRGRMPWR